MKILLKILFKLIIGFIALFIIALLGFIFYLETSSNKIASDEQWDKWEEEIKKTPELPTFFYEVYANMHPGVFNLTYKSYLLKSLFNRSTTCISSDLVGFPISWPFKS